MNQRLNLSAGPHVRDRWTTPFIMMVVLISLMPAAVIGVLLDDWLDAHLYNYAVVAVMLMARPA